MKGYLPGATTDDVRGGVRLCGIIISHSNQESLLGIPERTGLCNTAKKKTEESTGHWSGPRYRYTNVGR